MTPQHTMSAGPNRLAGSPAHVGDAEGSPALNSPALQRLQARSQSGAQLLPVSAHSPSLPATSEEGGSGNSASLQGAAHSPLQATRRGSGVGMALSSANSPAYSGLGVGLASMPPPPPPPLAPAGSGSSGAPSPRLQQLAPVGRLPPAAISPGGDGGSQGRELGAPPAAPPLSEEAAARIAALRKELNARLEELYKCSQLVSVFLNRCNAAWAEAQSWVAPPMVSSLQLQAFARSESFTVFKAEMVHLLFTGGLAVHLRAADDFLEPGLARSWGAPTDPAAASRDGVTSPNGSAAGGSGGGTAGERGLVAQSSFPGGKDGQAGGLGLGLLSQRVQAPDLWTRCPWRMLEAHRCGRAGALGQRSGPCARRRAVRGGPAAPALRQPCPCAALPPARDARTRTDTRRPPGRRPGMNFSGARLDGVSLGVRILASLVMAVEALAGREAVARLPLVLVVSEEQQDEVARQLWQMRFLGVPRENVVLIVQPAHPGHTYDAANRAWNQVGCRRAVRGLGRGLQGGAPDEAPLSHRGRHGTPADGRLCDRVAAAAVPRAPGRVFPVRRATRATACPWAAGTGSCSWRGRARRSAWARTAAWCRCPSPRWRGWRRAASSELPGGWGPGGPGLGGASVPCCIEALNSSERRP
jgi:hypothetical protein